MRIFPWGAFLVVSVVATGCGQVSVAQAKKGNDDPTSIEAATRGYQTWKLATNDYFKVAPEVWVLCRPPSAQEQAVLDASHSGLIRVYVNPVGEKAMFAKQPFPVGSVIVKERHETKVSDVDFCTVMRKREKGFNPTCGDWEFSVINAKNVATHSGKLENCMACHTKQGKLDYTFRTYLDKSEGKPIDVWRLGLKNDPTFIPPDPAKIKVRSQK